MNPTKKAKDNKNNALITGRPLKDVSPHSVNIIELLLSIDFHLQHQQHIIAFDDSEVHKQRQYEQREKLPKKFRFFLSNDERKTSKLISILKLKFNLKSSL